MKPRTLPALVAVSTSRLRRSIVRTSSSSLPLPALATGTHQWPRKVATATRSQNSSSKTILFPCLRAMANPSTSPAASSPRRLRRAEYLAPSSVQDSWLGRRKQRAFGTSTSGYRPLYRRPSLWAKSPNLSGTRTASIGCRWTPLPAR